MPTFGYSRRVEMQYPKVHIECYGVDGYCLHWVEYRSNTRVRLMYASEITELLLDTG